MKTTGMVDVTAFYLKFCVDESCGKCAPCRSGRLPRCSSSCSRLPGGRRHPGGYCANSPHLHSHANGLALRASAKPHPNPIISALRYFEHEFRAYIEGGTATRRKRKKALADGKNPPRSQLTATQAQPPRHQPKRIPHERSPCLRHHKRNALWRYYRERLFSKPRAWCR